MCPLPLHTARRMTGSRRWYFPNPSPEPLRAGSSFEMGLPGCMGMHCASAVSGETRQAYELPYSDSSTDSGVPGTAHCTVLHNLLTPPAPSCKTCPSLTQIANYGDHGLFKLPEVRSSMLNCFLIPQSFLFVLSRASKQAASTAVGTCM